MQNIKAIINNDNMNTLHQNKDIKDEYNCRNKKYCLKVGMFVAKYSLPIARTSSKIFYVNLTAVFSQTSPLIV